MNHSIITNIFQPLVVTLSLCACHSFYQSNNMRGLAQLENGFDAGLTVEAVDPLQAQAHVEGVTLRQMMYKAIEENCVDLVIRLAHLGVDLSKIDDDGNDAFVLATLKKDAIGTKKALADYLKALYNANPTNLVYSSNTGVRFLMLFSEICDMDTMRKILDAYPDEINQKDKHLRTALRYAIEVQDNNCIDLLVGRGANPHQRDDCGLSPIKIAFENLHDELANRMQTMYCYRKKLQKKRFNQMVRHLYLNRESRLKRLQSLKEK